MMKREFFIDTPLGKLKVYAKHKTDCAEDYPGVFIDFVSDRDHEETMLTCVEYDSGSKEIRTHVYGDALDDAPTDSVTHENLEESIDE